MKPTSHSFEATHYGRVIYHCFLYLKILGCTLYRQYLNGQFNLTGPGGLNNFKKEKKTPQ